MKLLFKQRFFSWLDSYDIYDENGQVAYSVEGKLSWGHCLHISDAYGKHIATVKEVVLTFLPKFELYVHDELIGSISKEFSLFKPNYHLDFKQWSVLGNFLEWDYQIKDDQDQLVASIGKELFHLTDTYTIDVYQSEDALYALMVVLAIDAEKCSRN